MLSMRMMAFVSYAFDGGKKMAENWGKNEAETIDVAIGASLAASALIYFMQDR